MYENHEQDINLGKDWPFQSQRLPLGHSRSYAAVNYSHLISDTLRAPDSLHLHLNAIEIQDVRALPTTNHDLKVELAMPGRYKKNAQKGTTKQNNSDHQCSTLACIYSTPKQCSLELALLGSFSTPAAKSASFLSKPFNTNDH
jgi:hypothetical protein